MPLYPMADDGLEVGDAGVRLVAVGSGERFRTS